MRLDAIRAYGLRGKGFSFRDNRLIKAMKAFHLLAALAWGGGALAMQALGFLRRSLDDPQAAAQVAACSHFVDSCVVMPGLAGCVLSGLFYSLCTSIGFFRFAWIGYKWLITCCAGFWGTMFWGPWGDRLIEALRPWGLDWTLALIKACILPDNIWTGLLQLAIILSMCLISVYRPLSFRFWAGKTEKAAIAARSRAARAGVENSPWLFPQDNVQAAAIYRQWLGRPMGPLARRHLHAGWRDKSGLLAGIAEPDGSPGPQE